MELLIIVLLVIVNGVFAMSELAVVSARKPRLEELAEDGNKGAQTAIDLVESPNRFLSTVQIGITLIGILAGAFGGATIAQGLREQLATIPALAPYSDALSVAAVVALTTYLSLVLGELVPKRLALQNPERIAVIVSRPMNILSKITAPIVSLLSFSTDGLLRLLGVNTSESDSVTEGEILALMHQGTLDGAFHRGEPQMVEGVLRLDEIRVESIMTPRPDVFWLDIESSAEEIREAIINNSFTVYPVCREDLDNVLGIVRAKNLLTKLLRGESIQLKATMQEAIFIPESASAANLLETFKSSGVGFALVVDEYGGTNGIVTMEDLIAEIVGDIDREDPEAVQRDDGSWLLDGLLPIHRLGEIFPELELPEDERAMYSTLGGFVMLRLGRIPSAADNLQYENLYLEVMDMDGNQVDKVLARFDP